MCSRSNPEYALNAVQVEIANPDGNGVRCWRDLGSALDVAMRLVAGCMRLRGPHDILTPLRGLGPSLRRHLVQCALHVRCVEEKVPCGNWRNLRDLVSRSMQHAGVGIRA
jgi:hypothetical protein